MFNNNQYEEEYESHETFVRIKSKPKFDDDRDNIEKKRKKSLRDYRKEPNYEG